MARVEECKKCNKPFAVTSDGGAAIEDYQEIDCPHCGDMWGKEKTAYVTSALTPEQEKEYGLRKK